MPDPRPRIAGLLGALMLLLAAALLWWGVVGRRGPQAPALPPVSVDITALDIVAAFDRRGPDVRVVAEEVRAPLLCVPARFEKDATLASDDTHKLIRAHAESAFEVQAGPFLPGARLIARTMVYSAARTDPARADPAPVTFRILVDGEERARLGSEYVRQVADVENPYDQLLRTLVVPLDGKPGKPITLRFETTRSGVAVPPDVVPAEPLWWELRVEQTLALPRQASGPGLPNLLVLMVDTLAARRVSLLGYARPTTPELAAFARRGTVFERAIAPASWTLPSVASLLTGLPPNTHGVLGDSRSYLMDGLTTWAEVLQHAGVAGLGLVTNPLVAEGTNFNQGFAEWQQANNETAEQVNARLLAWLDGQPPGARWFAYVHYMDPHAPYSAPGVARERFTGGYAEQRPFGGLLPGQLQRAEIPPFTGEEQQHVVDLYDGEVAYFDECFARLRDALTARGRLEDTIVVLVADHGEELFEHGRLGHGYALYDEQIHVPLLLVGPGVPAGVRCTARTGTIGLANTLLALARAPLLGDAAPPLLPCPAASASAASAEPVFSTVRTQLFGPRHSLASASDGEDRKVIVALEEGGAPIGTDRFDLRRDAAEVSALDPAGLSPDERGHWDRLQAMAQDWFTATAARLPPGEQPRSREVDGALEQLGYTGGGR